MRRLEDYGWTTDNQVDWSSSELADYTPARVIADYGRQYKIAAPQELIAQLAGSLVHKLASTDMPKVGDWVAVELSDDDNIIHAVLPRSSEIARGHIGVHKTKQVVATNVDLALVVQPLDQDFSLERLERYIFQLSQQNIETVILLNKSDAAKDALSKQEEVSSLSVKSVILSAKFDSDVTTVEKLIPRGKTAVIMGSSGAGKSTLTNRLLGDEVQATAAIRERDGKGRHTTVHRELFVLPSGGMIIDTPGIRELQLWGDAADLAGAFPDIAAVIKNCKYSNCSHTVENDCAVTSGLKSGVIDKRRYKAYQNFAREIKALEDKRGAIAERRTAHSKAVAKRRRDRTLRYERDNDLSTLE